MPDRLPYCGEAPHPSGWFAHWNFDPIILVALALLAFGVWQYRDRLRVKPCLLYTSDAADDSLRVDLGGCRFI